MSCLTSANRTKLTARKAIYETKLTAAYAALDGVTTDIESYRLDSGEGSQQAKRRKSDEITKLIRHLEAVLDSIDRRLCGTGVTTLVLRRRCY